jgi:hypothetical protein
MPPNNSPTLLEGSRDSGNPTLSDLMWRGFPFFPRVSLFRGTLRQRHAVQVCFQGVRRILRGIGASIYVWHFDTLRGLPA